MRALQVAQRARHLQPERIEGEERGLGIDVRDARRFAHAAPRESTIAAAWPIPACIRNVGSRP